MLDRLTRADGGQQAYISVVSDATAATATVPKEAAETVAQQLAEHGITAKPIALAGRFHSPAHAEHASRVMKLCEQHPELQLAKAGEKPRVPLRTNIDGEEIGSQLPHAVAVQSLLTAQAAWHRTVERALAALPQREGAQALAVGLVEYTPRACLEQGVRVHALAAPAYVLPGDAVAVVGMSCRFPGATSVDEFWRAVVREGASFVRDVPASRFEAAGLRRTLKRGSYRGCFIDEPDAFDARFFGAPAREAAAMDPQQRLFLQVAYEAAAAGGLLDETQGPRARDVGCWVGVGAVDYDDNVGSHQPSAFAALGTLRAFVGGRVSHFFGWTGPSLTIDTACSSSAVAVHAACAALRARECSAALAGGVNIITSPRLYQNLGAASFLSPRGVSSAFDAAADGYGRGEGAGVVVLKRLSDAVAAGDDVLAVIAASGVGQSAGDSPITVPNAASQADLIRRVAARAGIAPGDVTYVEAHGTGTPVGDPIELASVRQVFGGPHRARTLHVGSVKANIGHAEAASGAAGLIKAVLMIQHGVIPPLAGFRALNPRIPPLAASRMEIPQAAAATWSPGFRAACVNNYGAAGSNAALLVCQPPRPRIRSRPSRVLSAAPVCLAAHSRTSLRAQAAVLGAAIDRNPALSLRDLAAALARRRDHSLPLLWASTASSNADLRAQLAASLSSAVAVPARLPAVLVFGGQSTPFVGLAEAVYRESPVLREHVDRCDTLLRGLHRRSLFPAIFQHEPIDDLVTLHAGLFALQYASARAWIESGIRPQAVVGHSFGQTTALCISGALSLEHAMRLVTGRASLMQAQWGSDNGAMLAVEADESEAKALAARGGLDVACFNGPERHVLAGATAAIAALEAELARQTPPVRATRVRITHAYHCRLADAIMPRLKGLAEGLEFQPPVVPLETCSAGASWGSSPTATLVAEQTRQPVFFAEAVQRISARLGPCLWLEAGADTPVVRIARSALAPGSADHRFQPVALASHSNPLHALADVTAALWRAGQPVCFWPLRASPAAQPAGSVVLPPYQFDKSHHWLEFNEAFITEQEEKSARLLQQDASAVPQLLSLASRDGKTARFAVDARSEHFALCVSGHAVLGNSLCPASLYLELATRAAVTLAEGDASSLISRVTDLDIRAPLGLDAHRTITLRLDRVSGGSNTWRFSLRTSSEHAAGTVQLQPADCAAVASDFARYSRLVRASRCEELLARADVESLRGAVVYKVFSAVVDYAPYYRGVTAVAACGPEAAGAVEVPVVLPTPLKVHQCDPIAIDNFLQVAGLHINSLNQLPQGQVFICTQIQQIQLGPAFRCRDTPQRSWLVFSNVDRDDAANEACSDIFVFAGDTKTLALTILGVRFTQVAISSLTKVLSKTNPAAPSTRKPVATPKLAPTPESVVSRPKKRQPRAPSNLAAVRKLLQEVADSAAEDIAEDSALDDLGIDSLMVTELLGEIRDRFGVQVSAEKFQEARTIASLCRLLGPEEEATSSDTSDSDSESSSYVESGQTTPELFPTQDRADVLAKLRGLVTSHLELDALSMNMTIGDAGIDSLLSMELCSDIERVFGTKLDPSQMTPELTLEGLATLIAPHSAATSAPSASVPPPKISAPKPPSHEPTTAALKKAPTVSFCTTAAKCFSGVRRDFDIFAAETGFEKFCTVVYPRQAELVVSYVLEALEQLGCSLSACEAGERLPPIPHISKHDKVMNQFYALSEEAGLVTFNANVPVRTPQPWPTTPSNVLVERILNDFPQHVWEHKLLNTTGSKLADCLSGAVDPIHLVFADKESKHILENVYTHAPMFESGTMLLAKFLTELFGKYNSGEPIRILELGAGTGGTTKILVERLVQLGVPFTYTFTDLSPSLVAAAKRKFAQHDCMQYMVVDIEKTPPEHLLGQYHIVISTNCIHATKSLVNSTTNIRKTLRPDGIVCLVELTRNLFWFDLVFGLLEGWWLFNDGRKHVLADESFWESSLTRAGFKHIDWSNGDSVESDQLRVMLACASPVGESAKPTRASMETIPFKETNSNTLYADIYYPTEPDRAGVKRPIGEASPKTAPRSVY